MKKMLDRRGVTIVNALAVFLSVTVFSVTMISIGLAAVSNARATAEAEQSRLAVSSALRLVQSELDNAEITYTVSLEAPSLSNGYTETGTVLTTTYSSNPGASSVLGKALLKLVSTDSVSEDLTITATSEDADAKFSPVKVTLSLNRDNNTLTAGLTEMKTGADGSFVAPDNAYRYTLRFSGSVTLSETKKAYTYKQEDTDVDIDINSSYVAEKVTHYTWTVAGVS